MQTRQLRNWLPLIACLIFLIGTCYPQTAESPIRIGRAFQYKVEISNNGKTEAVNAEILIGEPHQKPMQLVGFERMDRGDEKPEVSCREIDEPGMNICKIGRLGVGEKIILRFQAWVDSPLGVKLHALSDNLRAERIDDEASAVSTSTGAIGGTVFSCGIKIVGAKVLIHNNATNEEKLTTSNEDGYYRVTYLKLGIYTVTIAAIGLPPNKVENVIVQVGSMTDVSPRLSAAGTAQNEDVFAEAPQINVNSAEFAPTLNQVAISNLPINGGRWSSFAILTPRVVSDTTGFGLLSFRGMSTLLNNNTVDGADDNQDFFSEERGRTRAGYSTPRIAIEEFRRNNYAYSYSEIWGRTANATQMTHRLVFNASYTWSHAIDYGQNSTTFSSTNDRLTVEVLKTSAATLDFGSSIEAELEAKLIYDDRRHEWFVLEEVHLYSHDGGCTDVPALLLIAKQALIKQGWIERTEDSGSHTLRLITHYVQEERGWIARKTKDVPLLPFAARLRPKSKVWIDAPDELVGATFPGDVRSQFDRRSLRAISLESFPPGEPPHLAMEILSVSDVELEKFGGFLKTNMSKLATLIFGLFLATFRKRLTSWFRRRPPTVGFGAGAA